MGAQLTVVPYSLLENMKIRPETMFQVQTTINGASNVPIMVEGGILVKITAYNPKTGLAKHSRQLAYVSKHVTMPYMSLSACIDLAMVPASFPELVSADNNDNPFPDQVQAIINQNPQKCSNTGVPRNSDTPCQCPTRSLPPTSDP